MVLIIEIGLNFNYKTMESQTFTSMNATDIISTCIQQPLSRAQSSTLYTTYYTSNFIKTSTTDSMTSILHSNVESSSSSFDVPLATSSSLLSIVSTQYYFGGRFFATMAIIVVTSIVLAVIGLLIFRYFANKRQMAGSYKAVLFSGNNEEAEGFARIGIGEEDEDTVQIYKLNEFDAESSSILSYK
jgi:hypothetical protein